MRLHHRLTIDLNLNTLDAVDNGPRIPYYVTGQLKERWHIIRNPLSILVIQPASFAEAFYFLT